MQSAARKFVEAVDLAAARDEREHRFVRAPAAAEYSVAELTAAAVFVICGAAEFGGQMCDVVEQFACPGRRDGASGTVDHKVRNPGEQTTQHPARPGGGVRGGWVLCGVTPGVGRAGGRLRSRARFRAWIPYRAPARSAHPSRIAR